MSSFTSGVVTLFIFSSFPVQMIISLPNGTVVHNVNANDLLDFSNESPTISQ